MNQMRCGGRCRYAMSASTISIGHHIVLDCVTERTSRHPDRLTGGGINFSNCNILALRFVHHQDGDQTLTFLDTALHHISTPSFTHIPLCSSPKRPSSSSVHTNAVLVVIVIVLVLILIIVATIVVVVLVARVPRPPVRRSVPSS